MDPEILKTRKRLIVHADCADGIASAMIIRCVLPDIEVVAVQYGTEQHRTLERRIGDIYCDFTPHRDLGPTDGTMTGSLEDDEALQWFDDVVVLDHHKQAKDLVLSFPRGVFADEEKDPGVSGATLAYREVWQPIGDLRSKAVASKIEEFAALAGVRDTWQRDDPQWEDACSLANALRFFGLRHFLDHPSGRHPAPMPRDEFEMGRLLYQKERETTKKQAAAVWILAEVAYMNSLDTSDVAEELRTAGSKAKMLAGFAFRADPTTDELRLVWSLRSIAPGVDVGAMAKTRGGGGHTRAAAFSERALSLDGYRGGYPFEGLLIPPRFSLVDDGPQ